MSKLTFAALAILVAGFVSGHQERLHHEENRRRGYMTEEESKTVKQVYEEFDIKYDGLTGTSNCVHGKQCVALVVYVRTNDKDKTQIFKEGSKEYLQRSTCATLANAMYHTHQFPQEFGSKWRYGIDVVFMHDENIPERHLNMIRSFGARTLALSDDIKRMSCRGYLKSNIEEAQKLGLTQESCNKPFSEKYLPGEFLSMIESHLKLAAFGLAEYDAVVHIEPTTFVRSTKKLLWKLDVLFGHPAMEFIGETSDGRPLSHSSWITRPSSQAVQIWLKDLEAGFNPLRGWSNATSDSSLSHENNWTFEGSDGVRGLLYHIYTLKLGEKHPAASKRIHTDSKDVITEANGIEAYGIQPWDLNPCGDKLYLHNKKQRQQ